MARVTVILNKDREAMVEASGKTLVELIDLALDTLAMESEKAQSATTGTAREAFRKADCKHPKARRAKGLCMACGTYVGTTT